MKSFIPNVINSIILTAVILLASPEKGESNSVTIDVKIDNKEQTVSGQTGGEIDSKGCGFIAKSPNHVMTLPERIDYMRLTVKAAGGQPTLLVLGPNSGDSFCVLGDDISGLNPEISGVWEPGKYQIYVGDRVGKNYQFTLNISTDADN